MYDCIIFDVDGTLIDTENAVLTTYRKVFLDEFHRDILPEELRAAYGVPTGLAMKNLGFKNVREAEENYHKHLFKEFCNVKPFNGILPVLEILKSKGIVTGIVTSRDKKEVTNDVCLQGLITYFQYVICTDDTEKHKPDPEPLLKLIEKTGLKASNVLYIGDTYFDYMCAKSAGVDFALALWGTKSSVNINAKYNMDKPADILQLYSHAEP